MNMLNSYGYPKHDIEYIKHRNATNIAQLDVEMNNRSILKPALWFAKQTNGSNSLKEIVTLYFSQNHILFSNL